MVSAGVEDTGKKAEKMGNAKVSKGGWKQSRVEVHICLGGKQKDGS